MTDKCFLDDETRWIAEYRSLAIRQNDYPIAGLHLLLSTKQHREQLTPVDLGDAQDFARLQPGYRIFHNMRGSGATRPDHVHFQALLAEAPWPIEIAPREHCVTATDGSSISRLSGYPVRGLVVSGPQTIEMVFTIVEQLRPRPFNLVVLAAEIFVIPRTQERPDDFAEAFAGLEISGCVVLTDEERYQNVRFEEIRKALQQCGLSPCEWQALEEGLLSRLERSGWAQSRSTDR